MSARRWRLPRWSLRINVALLVLGVAMAPLLLVAAWLRMERQFESAMQKNVAFTLREAEAALAAPKAPRPSPTNLGAGVGSGLGLAALSEPALEGVARVHRARVRLLTQTGQVLADYDYDWGRDLSERAGGVVLGRKATLAAAHEPGLSRDVLGRISARGAAEGCEDEPESGMVLCYAARRVRHEAESCVLHVQDSADRPLPLLYALRFQLGRLTLVILPFALLLAAWVGRRLVGPIEALRDQVLAKVKQRRPAPDLRAPASHETAQLAEAFNTLLERLEERQNDNQAFVADLVHEFKNPVATIRACAESLGASEVTPERAQRLSRLLHESSLRLDALVSQFLELARAEAGMQREAREVIDLAELARARVANLRDDERWAGLKFELDAPQAAPLRGVPERLETVLDNLLANAASFAKPAGTVRVVVRVAGDRIELGVSDDGPGIAPEDTSRVFERFFTTRRHDKGTGLGLALVRAIVEAHGGGVSVRSELGAGATFSAWLPGAG
jgi:signal transduction histidine kinase